MLLQAQLEEQLRDKVLQEKELAQLQVQSSLDKADLSARWVLGRHHARQASLQAGHPEMHGWALPLREASHSSQAPRLAEGESEVQRALAQGTS